MRGRGHVRRGGMHDREACMVGGLVCMVGGERAWHRGMHGRGACVAGGRAWQERRPLQQPVRILLECTLVIYIHTLL